LLDGGGGPIGGGSPVSNDGYGLILQHEEEVVEVRHRSIGAWGQKWRCSPRRRGPWWSFGTKSTATAALRPPELDKRTHRRGGAARGSFLRAEGVTHEGIEGAA
jgi:hypothetical protein